MGARHRRALARGWPHGWGVLSGVVPPSARMSPPPGAPRFAAALPRGPPHGLPGPRAQDGLPVSSPRAPAVRARVTAAWPGPGLPELCDVPARPPCLLPRCLTCCPWVRGPRRWWVFASCSGVGTEAAEIAPRAARLSSARHVLTTVRNPHDSPLRVTN